MKFQNFLNESLVLENVFMDNFTQNIKKLKNKSPEEIKVFLKKKWDDFVNEIVKKNIENQVLNMFKKYLDIKITNLNKIKIKKPKDLEALNV